METDSEAIAVTRFREYIRINTSHPDPDYDGARRFYEKYAAELGLTFTSVQLTPNRTMEILTWTGSDVTLPSVMLYCHTDVVPSFPDHWKYPPLSAYKDEQGNIYGRGTQDMKCVGIQYLEAIRELSKGLNSLEHFTWYLAQCNPISPRSSSLSAACQKFGLNISQNEEIGGVHGMTTFVRTEEFRKLNIGFALDEGLASSEEHFRVFYAERNVWWLEVTCHGNPGHGSAFLANTAAEKLRRVINRFLEHRQQQQQRLTSDPSLSAGDVTSINLTIMKGGVQYNVVPESFTAGFDIRIPPTESLEDFDKMLEEWRIEAGSDVTYTYHHKTNSTSNHITPTDDSNPWWIKFSRACQSIGITIRKEIFPAGTDGRQLRLLGLPVLGFSPINNTPILLHDHNEYLNEAVFLRGVSIYKQILRELGSP